LPPDLRTITNIAKSWNWCQGKSCFLAIFCWNS